MSNISLWSYGSTIFILETQIWYTQYVDNDVYVDDVDDDEAGAGAYVLHCEGNGWIIRTPQCRGQACLLHAALYAET